MKKIIFIVCFILILAIFSLFLFPQKTPPAKKASPVPTPYSATPTPPVPTEGWDLYNQQVRWGQQHQQYLEENPWRLKLPLKSNDYFVSYDPDNDQILATVYYFSSDPAVSSQQIENAKGEALTAINALDPNFAKKQISFTAFLKTP
jgi:hypothetical protein